MFTGVLRAGLTAQVIPEKQLEESNKHSRAEGRGGTANGTSGPALSEAGAYLTCVRSREVSVTGKKTVKGARG